MKKNSHLKLPDKKSFLLYCDQSSLIEKLTDEQAGKLIKQIYSYCENGRTRPEISDPLEDIVFTAIQTSLDRDHLKYLKIVERNRNNGQLGGRPKNNPVGSLGTQKTQTNPENPSEPDSDSDSDSDIKEIYSRVITYLNKKTGKNFRVNSKDSILKINARLNEKYKPEDFKTVIDNKTAQWLDDPENCIYLRPSTLFGNKFESYLNEKPVNGTKTNEELLKEMGL